MSELAGALLLGVLNGLAMYSLAAPDWACVGIGEVIFVVVLVHNWP